MFTCEECLQLQQKVCVHRVSEACVSHPVLSLSAKPEQMAGYRPSTLRATAVIFCSLGHRRHRTAQNLSDAYFTQNWKAFSWFGEC